MRMSLIATIFVISAAAHASSTLRVGNRVLTAGDSQERVTDLLGKPTSRSHKRSARHQRGRVRVLSSTEGGELWRYRRNGHVIVVTLVNGRVKDIDDSRL